ncbi:MAG: cytochrome C [Proteobacteria bacterium]|nr:cytochrome C [Pseudomonadota bacterium]
MSQLFPPSANTIARLVLLAIPAVPLTAAALGAAYEYSDYATNVGMYRDQPVPFSHKHHVGDDGIDCRFCHFGVEKSPIAGVPPSEVCMTCHSQLWRDARVLAPLHRSFASGTPLRWQAVNRLPDYVYFDHSIHIAKGIGCSSCHGAVDTMPLTFKAQSLTMEFCLSCHRAPEQQVRSSDQIFNMHWRPPADQATAGPKLVQSYHISKAHLTDCSICHR